MYTLHRVIELLTVYIMDVRRHCGIFCLPEFKHGGGRGPAGVDGYGIDLPLSHLFTIC